MAGLIGTVGHLISNLTDPTLNSISNTLTNTLSQVQQNGGGTWGTLQQPTLPKWFGGPNAGSNTNGMQPPWGGITTTNTNPYTQYPNTQVTRHYDFSVSECTIAPDGVQLNQQICANGQFPGPLIEANYGDWIEGKLIISGRNILRLRR